MANLRFAKSRNIPVVIEYPAGTLSIHYSIVKEWYKTSSGYYARATNDTSRVINMGDSLNGETGTFLVYKLRSAASRFDLLGCLQYVYFSLGRSWCADGVQGGVKASLSLAGITVTTDLAYPPSAGEGGLDSPSAQMDVPASVRFGMPLVTEAWCYDENSTEIGYAKTDKPLRNRHIPVVNVLAPLKAKPTFDEASECVAPTEQRGVELCVKSDLY